MSARVRYRSMSTRAVLLFVISTRSIRRVPCVRLVVTFSQLILISSLRVAPAWGARIHGPLVPGHRQGASAQHDRQLRSHVHAVGAEAIALRGRDRRALRGAGVGDVRARSGRATRGGVPRGVRGAGGVQRDVGLRDDREEQRVARRGSVVRVRHDGESAPTPSIGRVPTPFTDRLTNRSATDHLNPISSAPIRRCS